MRRINLSIGLMVILFLILLTFSIISILNKNRDIRADIYNDSEINNFFPVANEKLVSEKDSSFIDGSLESVYRDVINNFNILNFPESYFYTGLANQGLDGTYTVDLQICLHDLDNDRIPELLILAQESSIITTGSAGMAYEVYIFKYVLGESVLSGTLSYWEQPIWGNIMFLKDPFSDRVHLTYLENANNYYCDQIYTFNLEDGYLVRNPLLEWARIGETEEIEYRFRGEVITKEEYDLNLALLYKDENIIPMHNMTMDGLLEGFDNYNLNVKLKP